MDARTFRSFVESGRGTADVLHIDQPGSLDELGRIIRKEERGQNRSVLFDRVEGWSGRMAGNVFGSAARIHRSVATTDDAAFFAQVDQAVRNPKRIVEQPGAFEQSADIALLRGRIPLIMHSESDSTPYITSGVVLARHPQTGRHHLCFVRLAVVEDDLLLFNGVTPRIKAIVDHAMTNRQPLDVLILIGAPSHVLLAGALSLPDAVDELEVVQAWAGDQLSFTPQGLPVPNGTEMVLFGQVLPEYRPEGPFGDSFGTYSTRTNPVCRISAVWQQTDPIYHVLLGGVSNEHIELLILKAKHALEHVRAGWNALRSYALPAHAGGRLCILAVDENHGVEPHLPALFAAPLVRTFILVNADVDPESSDDILWAMTRRTDGARSFHFSDSSASGVNKVVIDAAGVDLSDWNQRRIESGGASGA